MDFITARNKAFEYNSERNNLKILSQAELTYHKLPTNVEVWSVETEVGGFRDGVVKTTLYIALEHDFPLSFPKVYISKKLYQTIGLIPHLNPDRQLCIIDSDLSIPNSKFPELLIEDCIRIAKDLLEKGIRKANTEDFKSEFLTYWEIKYEHEPSLLSPITSIIEDTDPTKLGLIIYPTMAGTDGYYLHSFGESYSRIKDYFTFHGISFIEDAPLYIGKIDAGNPPFVFTHRKLIDIIRSKSEESHSEFVKFVNSATRNKLIVFKTNIEERECFLGFVVPPSNKGVGNKLYYQDFSTSQANLTLQRFSPRIISIEKIHNRTMGVLEEPRKLSLCVIGLGSVGSNLVHFLNTLFVDQFRFIDFDYLTVDNIGRHFLGNAYVSLTKPLAMKYYLIEKYPLQKIQIKVESVITVIENDLDFINDCDFVFVAIGKFNHENWINEQQLLGRIKKPIFYVWVEPYLAGGHLIFMPPGNRCFESLYDKDTFYNYNIVSKSAYSTDKRLSLREAGCNTTFIPYSSCDLVQFLSAAFPSIKDSMYTNPKKGYCLSWVGDVSFLNKNNIALSEFAKRYNYREVIIHEF